MAAGARKLGLTREALTDLTDGQLRAVAGAATGTCSAGCGYTLDLDCDGGFTNGCTENTHRLCITSIC